MRSGLALASALLAAGCGHGSDLPPDNIQTVSTSGTTVVTMPANPRRRQPAYAIAAPAGLRQSPRYPNQILYGDDVLILVHYLPEPNTAEDRDHHNLERETLLKALSNQTKAPEGYAVAAPWFGTVTEQKNADATRWNVAYNLVDGNRYLNVHCAYAPGSAEAERRAKEGAAFVIRTLKAKG